jgi:class 3 adenylate cyclase
VLASDSILERASEPESESWRLDGTVTLRGRGEQTRLAEPVRGD